MTNPTRIVSSPDESVNQLARAKLGLPPGHPVGFEMLGRPPKKGELWTDLDDPPMMVDDLKHRANHDFVKYEAFRVVALGPDGKPCEMEPHGGACMAKERTTFAAKKAAIVAEIEAQGRVRVVPPAKQYVRIEMELSDGKVWLEWHEGRAAIAYPPKTGFLVEDLPILAEAFRVAHHEWTKEES